jgi:hypothetical protein
MYFNRGGLDLTGSENFLLQGFFPYSLEHPVFITGIVLLAKRGAIFKTDFLRNDICTD